MAYFNEFPNTRTYDSDLGWLISAVSKMQEDMEGMEKITYHDPIGWNISTQYEKNTVVKDPLTDVLYLSSQPVPAGVSLTNTDYWIAIGDFSYTIQYLKDAICTTDEGDSLTATRSYSVGDFLWWSDKLYKAIAVIHVGDAFGNNNIQNVQIVNLLEDIQTIIDNDVAGLQTKINDLSSATQWVQTKGKNIVWFGDSWTFGVGADDNDSRYSTLVSKRLGMTEYNYSVGAAGFTISGNTIADQITTASAGMTTAQKNNTAIVVIMGGVNDWRHNASSYTATTFSAEVRSVIYAAHAAFPNSKIVLAIGNTGYRLATNGYRYWIEYTNYHCAYGVAYPIQVIDNFINYLGPVEGLFTADGLHPNNSAHALIAGKLSTAIMGGKVNNTTYLGALSLPENWGTNHAIHFIQQEDMIHFGGAMINATDGAVTANTLIGQISAAWSPRDNAYLPIAKNNLTDGSTFCVVGNPSATFGAVASVRIIPASSLTANFYIPPASWRWN